MSRNNYGILRDVRENMNRNSGTYPLVQLRPSLLAISGLEQIMTFPLVKDTCSSATQQAKDASWLMPLETLVVIVRAVLLIITNRHYSRLDWQCELQLWHYQRSAWKCDSKLWYRARRARPHRHKHRHRARCALWHRHELRYCTRLSRRCW